jgi:hypothetical protein
LSGGESNKIAIEKDCKSIFVAHFDFIFRVVVEFRCVEIEHSQMLAPQLLVE